MHLPIGFLVYDAETFQLVYANPLLLNFVDPNLTLDELVGFHLKRSTTRSFATPSSPRRSRK